MVRELREEGSLCELSCVVRPAPGFIGAQRVSTFPQDKRFHSPYVFSLHAHLRPHSSCTTAMQIVFRAEKMPCRKSHLVIFIASTFFDDATLLRY